MRSIQISEASCISPFKNAHSAFHARPRVIVSPSLCERRRLLNTITPHVAHPARQRGGLQVVAAIKKSTGKQVACNKTLVALQGKEDAVDVLCKEVVAFTRERQTDRKAGILTFECSKVNSYIYISLMHDCRISQLVLYLSILLGLVSAHRGPHSRASHLH